MNRGRVKDPTSPGRILLILFAVIGGAVLVELLFMGALGLIARALGKV
jgi:hypothetical protein